MNGSSPVRWCRDALASQAGAWDSIPKSAVRSLAARIVVLVANVRNIYALSAERFGMPTRRDLVALLAAVERLPFCTLQLELEWLVLQTLVDVERAELAARVQRERDRMRRH